LAVRQPPRLAVRFLAPTLLFLFAACVARAPVETGSPDLCVAAARAPRWAMATGLAVRDLTVWIDEPAQEFEGWSVYGWRRLRAAMARWNALHLPVHLVDARSARNADIIVNVIETVPGTGEGRDWDQQGVTNLTFAEGGALIRAHVFVATRAPTGARVRLDAQQANLLHELGHALGLPHAASTRALMSARRDASTLTSADITLARAFLGCPRGA
jgi:hypothetical protein